MLKLKNVSKFYYSKGIIATGFSKINLELKIGEFVAITGESGSGKSTLLNVLSGVDSYEEGEMYIQGKETSHYTEKDFEEYRRKYVANIFQEFNLINSYTVYQNVELVLLLNGYKKKDVKAKILEIIEQVGLTELKNTKVSKLSGGQKQRVAIARAMVKDTPIILADEPTGNLDTASAKDVIEILKKVAKDKLVIIVTHDLEQVEEFATRIITMHDGKIIENREVKKVDKDKTASPSKFSKITLNNKYRLGIRNTFNIIPKFLLLFLVFFFITAAVFTEYASFKLYEATSKTTVQSAWRIDDLSENRILINKADRSYFTEEDFVKVQNVPNVKKLAKDDICIDTYVNMSSIENSFSINSTVQDIENFEGEVDVGRLPENENEVVCLSSRKHYYVKERLNEILSTTLKLQNLNDKEIKVVGIKYKPKEEDYDYNFKIYAKSSLIAELRKVANKSNCKVRIFFNNKYQESNSMTYNILPSSNVKKGKAIVFDGMKYELTNGNIINKDIKIIVDNIYYSDELNLKISNTYTKSNFKRITGYNNYDNNTSSIFINEEEYNSLYDKPSYQASVYVENMEEIENTIAELKSMGLEPKKVTDFVVNNWILQEQILKIAKVIITIIVVFVLFFISYFIIKIILKSRNIYYTTLRILGATSKSVKRILDIELFLNSTLAYGGILAFLYLVKTNVINIDYIAKLTNYVGFIEYALLYIVLITMSRLISRRFAKKIFKNTVISTYKEEV